MFDPKQELAATLKQFMQENQQEILQQAMEIDPLEFQKEAVGYMEDVIELTKTFIALPRDAAVDSLVEKKVKNNLLSIYKQLLSELSVCSKDTLIIYDSIMKYCNDYVDKSLIDNRLKNVILSKLAYLTTGVKDNKELLSFEWSIESIQKHLNVNIDFTSEVNTLFIGYPAREVILKFIKDSCEVLNHQYKRAVKIFLVKFNEITEDAKKDAITSQQCAKWIQEIVKEINIEVTIKRHQQKISNIVRRNSNDVPANENHSAQTDLLPPGSAIQMTDLSKQQKVPVILLNESEISAFNQEVLNKAMSKIDLSALPGLIAELGDGLEVNSDQAGEFIQGFMQGFFSSIMNTQPEMNIQTHQNKKQVVSATASAFVNTNKLNSSNPRLIATSLLSNSIQHTLLPPPLVPPNPITSNTAETISNVLATTKQEEDFKSNLSFSIRQEP